VFDTLERIHKRRPDVSVIVGGILASLIPNSFPSWCYVFKGYSKKLDAVVPDYKITYGNLTKWSTFSYVFTSRGCINSCGYCAVPKIEKGFWINKDWRNGIDLTKKNVQVYDNNLTACPKPHVEEVCAYLVNNKIKTCFDNGFDIKHVDKESLSIISKVSILDSGFRLAFDRIEEDGLFQEKVLLCLENGISKKHILSYVLFNFTDLPCEAIYRAEECVKLGIRPYPQQYSPLNALSRDNPFISKYWTKGLAHIFRNFFLFAGMYTKMSFREYLHEKNGIAFHLKKEDIAALERKEK
jgi:hypothetical protein